jgi:four helix bundle suffix protein
MIQAARSGRQNIAEGSRAAAVSSQTELRLVNVARASLEELLLDFEDYLRHRRLHQWSPDSPEALEIRQIASQTSDNQPNLSDRKRWELYARWLEHEDPSVRANAVICLIHQANYLLDHQIEALEKGFIESGGYTEQLATARLAARRQSQKDTPTQLKATEAPICPDCDSPMLLRMAKTGRNAGTQFWGCSAYPECKRILELDEA